MTTLVPRNDRVRHGRRTSIRLEPELWDALEEICQREGLTQHELCVLIDRRRGAARITSAIRVFMLRYFRAAATEEGHPKAGQMRDTKPLLRSCYF